MKATSFKRDKEGKSMISVLESQLRNVKVEKCLLRTWAWEPGDKVFGSRN